MVALPEPTSAVTSADLAVLRLARGRLGVGSNPYACVYRHKTKWRARVCKHLNLPGPFTCPREAAEAVVAWYRDRYGAKWPEVFAARKCAPWRVRHRKTPEGTYYVAEVWVEGRIVTVTRAGTLRKPRRRDGDAYLWPTRAAAKRAVACWVYYQLGLFAPVLLWRPVRPPKNRQAPRSREKLNHL